MKDRYVLLVEFNSTNLVKWLTEFKRTESSENVLLEWRKTRTKWMVLVFGALELEKDIIKPAVKFIKKWSKIRTAVINATRFIANEQQTKGITKWMVIFQNVSKIFYLSKIFGKNRCTIRLSWL